MSSEEKVGSAFPSEQDVPAPRRSEGPVACDRYLVNGEANKGLIGDIVRGRPNFTSTDYIL